MLFNREKQPEEGNRGKWALRKLTERLQIKETSALTVWWMINLSWNFAYCWVAMETPRGWKTWQTCTQTLKPSYSAPFISLWCVSKGQLSVVMILSDTEWRDTGRRIKVLDCLWLEAFRRTIINVTRKDKPGNNWHTLLESSGTQTIVKQHEKIMQMWKRSNFGLPCLSSVGVCRVI